MMAFTQFLKSIFKVPDEQNEEVVGEKLDYKGFTIEAMPLREGSYFRTAGYISGELDGEMKRIQFIRADQNSDKQMAIDHAIRKAQQIIDEQGGALLKRDLL